MSGFLKEVVELTKEKRALDQKIGEIKYEIEITAISGLASVLYISEGPTKKFTEKIAKTFCNLGFKVEEEGSELKISWAHKL